MKALLLVLLLAPLLNAVVLQGTVFDSSLTPVAAIVEISNPRQVAAAPNGTYSFTVQPNTNYSITARTTGEPVYQETLNLEVGSEDVRFDVILLTPSDVDDDLVDIVKATGSLDSDLPGDTVPSYWIAIAAIAAFIVAAILVSRPQIVKKIVQRSEKNKKEENTSAPAMEKQRDEKTENTVEKREELKIDSFKEQILKLISEKGGAVEQKELRRELPWSEARVSIELTELEKMGKVRKIKKGRANLVKLV